MFSITRVYSCLAAAAILFTSQSRQLACEQQATQALVLASPCLSGSSGIFDLKRQRQRCLHFFSSSSLAFSISRLVTHGIFLRGILHGVSSSSLYSCRRVAPVASATTQRHTIDASAAAQLSAACAQAALSGIQHAPSAVTRRHICSDMRYATTATPSGSNAGDICNACAIRSSSLFIVKRQLLRHRHRQHKQHLRRQHRHLDNIDDGAIKPAPAADLASALASNSCGFIYHQQRWRLNFSGRDIAAGNIAAAASDSHVSEVVANFDRQTLQQHQRSFGCRHFCDNSSAPASIQPPQHALASS